MEGIKSLYDHRFSFEERKTKEKVWAVLCRSYFQQYVDPKHDTVLDLACGFGEFTRHIEARRRIALDINPAAEDIFTRWCDKEHQKIEFKVGQASKMHFLTDQEVDVCFTSNFFEHLPNKYVMDEVLSEVWRVLKPGGRFIALQPNLHAVGNKYWDYYDHHLPLTPNSCKEGFIKSGFTVQTLIPKFLPYTTKGALPKHPLWIRLYLSFPPLWRLLGGQFLIVGQKPA
ncbi:MAG: class I SAM-dependent methyltransferase [Magnetococcales bacterium]|nr:class I SAM-dependent methyltransferase [Magnetococcales bacterium]